MSTYLFQLGNTPELSLRELTHVRPGIEFKHPIESIAEAELKDDSEAKELMEKLGGTIKIMKVLAENEQVSPDGLPSVLSQLLDGSEKVQFAIAELGRDHLPPINPAKIKDLLQDKGTKVRYRKGSRHGLSAAVILNTKDIRELYVVQTEDKTYVAETIAVQDIDEWSLRDRSKPYADRKKGMLPPKVARMMVNIAVGNTSPENKVVIDPFCGSGTVLMEAAMLGFDVIGSDIDTDSVSGTRDNINWLKNQFSINVDAEVMKQDAAHLDLKDQKIEFVVTEPFLGKPKPNPSKLPFIFKGLKRMYLGAFRQWTAFLKNGARIVVVFPYVETDIKGKTKTFNLDELIDKFAELGYTTNSNPVLYHRRHAIVQRQIYTFTFEKPEIN